MKEETSKSLSERLIRVQMKLNAPKNQKNSFGGYNYRSAEDILEAVKPLLDEEGLLLTISDELVNVGDRYYVKANATIWAGDRVSIADDEVFTVTAFAREPADKKGMDESQITGAASSYARKYALNGLFAIDDAKDADTDEHRRQVDNTPHSAPKASTTAKGSAKQRDYLVSLMQKAGIEQKAIDAKLATLDTAEEFSNAIEKMKAKVESGDATE